MASRALQIESLPSATEGRQVYRLAGTITISTMHDFQRTLRAVTAQSLILDFTAVAYIDSAGLGVLVAAMVAAQREGRRLALVGINERVKALLDMTGVGNLFKTYATLAQAEEATV